MPENSTQSGQAFPTTPQKAGEDKELFLRRALARFELASEAESTNRKEDLDDVEFSIGNQWPDEIRTQRIQDGRPCLTMNRIAQNLRIVENEQRQQRPAIQVNPVGDGADVETAEILQGIVRHIEINSEAEIAYDHAFDSMLRGSLGWFRWLTDYASPTSNEQEIFVRPVKNPFSVYSDPAGWKLEGFDPKWLFIVEDMPTEEYRAFYPNSKLAALTEYDSSGTNQAGWMGEKFIRVAEYYYVLETVTSKEGEREVTKREVKWAKINMVEILEERDIIGEDIPVQPVIGEEVEINGKIHRAGLVRYMKDPARMYNYWVTAGTEMIALAPKAPFIAAAGQTEQYSKQWGQANVRNMGTLPYDPVSVDGHLVPAPARDVYEPPVQAIQAMTRQADADLKYTSGINAASLGDPEAERSGKAVLLRQKQSDIANLNWSDNLSRAIRRAARIMLRWIPKVYDTPRIQRIFNPDQTVEHVITHNGPEQAQQAQLMMTESIHRIYDLGLGRYDVTVTVGPSYQSKRQEAVASQLALLQTFPQAAPILGDLIVRGMDWPGKDEMADRLKMALPPQFQDKDATDPKAQLQLAQSQLAQLGQQHDLLAQEVQKLSREKEAKVIENEYKLKIEEIKSDTAIAVAQVGSSTNILSERIDALERLQMQFHDQAHQVAMSSHEHGQAQELASQQAQQAQDQQASQQGHEQDMASQAAAQQQEQPQEA